jgi:glycosyltransferase involved in cell wall biosynthesis
LSKYYPHKNFEILFNLADKLIENNIKVHLTLDKNIKSEAKIIKRIDENSLNNVLINIGYVSSSNLCEVYQQNDGLFLPTLLESFSTNYIEAFKFGIPIFTSNLDFAKEVCEDAAFYFNPYDASDIINTIMQAFKNPIYIQDKVLKGKNILKQKYSKQINIFDKIFYSI